VHPPSQQTTDNNDVNMSTASGSGNNEPGSSTTNPKPSENTSSTSSSDTTNKSNSSSSDSPSSPAPLRVLRQSWSMLQWSPDDKYLLAAGSTNEAAVWNVQVSFDCVVFKL
jgi:hypothetical protein